MTDELPIGFLPYLRQGMAAHSTAGGTRALHVDVRAGAAVAPIEVPFVLAGPEQVIAIDEAIIARVFPAPGSADLDYNLFPSIEFRDPDFPWRYSYGAATDGRLDPWLVLVVLPRGRFTVEDLAISADDPRTIRCLKPAEPLDLSKVRRACYAWAHVQLTDLSDVDRAALDRLCQGDNGADVFSRLLCPAMLAPTTAYTAFVLPAMEAWWSSGKSCAEVGYPIYYTWDFTTSAHPDLESLFERIRRGAVERDTIRICGQRYLDLRSDPALLSLATSEQFELRAALTRPRGGAAGPPIEPAALQACHDRLVAAVVLQQGCPTCREPKPLVGDEPGDCAGPTGQPHPPLRMIALDPYVGVPMYGSYHATAVVPPTQLAADELPWIYELNLSAEARIAAGLGAEVVRRHQDDFVQYCWTHREELGEADRLERRQALGALVNDGLWRRQFPATDTNQYLARLAPALRGAPSLAPLAATGLTRGVLAPAFQRLVRHKLRGREPIVTATDPRWRDFVARRINEKVSATPAAKPRVYDFAIDVPLRTALGRVNQPSFVAELDTALRTRSDVRRDAVRARPAATVRGIPHPMYAFLAALSRDYLLPGLDEIPANHLVLLEPNPRFIEAFLLGLDHELARELIWREVPLPIGLTLFRHFWDRASDVDRPDILPIHEWPPRSPLGTHAAGPTAVRSVILLRADFLKIYHDVIVELFVSSGGDVVEHALEVYSPLGDDLVLFGLPIDVEQLAGAYLQFSEHPGLPRFGLAATPPQPPPRPERVTIAGLRWDHVRCIDIGAAGSWIDASLGPADGVTVVDDEGAALTHTADHPFWTHGARGAHYTLQQPVQVRVLLDWLQRAPDERPR